MAEEIACPYCGNKLSAPGGALPKACPICGEVFPKSVLNFSSGRTISDYVLERHLEIGGMGEVFLARQKSVNREVALKILPSSLAKNKDYLGRFFNEVRMLAQIEHPNVVQAIEGGIEKGVPYFAMMYISGKDIKRHLDSGRIFSELEAIKIVKKIAEALNYVWRRHKIIHRDIKPANIMLTPEGDVKLMDLGISKMLKEGHKDLTAAGMMVGSPTYISPEQAKAEKNLDFRADMYSLGACYYHMIVGAPPYDAETPVGVIAMHLTEPPPDVRKLNPNISDKSAELIYVMMAKAPEDRYEDWDAAISEIDSIIEELTEESPKSSDVLKKTSRPRAPVLPLPFKLSWHRTIALLIVLVLFIVAFVSVVRKSLREAKINHVAKMCKKAKTYALKCPQEERSKAIALLEAIQRLGVPEYAKKARDVIEELRLKAIDEKKLLEKTNKLSALRILKRKSYKLEMIGAYGKAIKMWSHYQKYGEFRSEPKFIKETERSLDYLKRKQKEKEEGLLDE